MDHWLLKDLMNHSVKRFDEPLAAKRFDEPLAVKRFDEPLSL